MSQDNNHDTQAHTHAGSEKPQAKKSLLSRIFKKAVRAGVRTAIGLTFTAFAATSAYTLIYYSGRGDKLTTGETELVESVFGDQLDASRVRKHFRDSTSVPAHVSRFFIGPKRAIVLPTTSHVDFYGQGSFSNDFSLEDADKFGLFMHELTHVWQSQECWNFKKIGVYEYTIDSTTKFKKLGIEQQASMMEDYARYFLHPEQGASLGYAGADKHTPAAYTKIRGMIEENFPAARNTRIAYEKAGKTAQYFYAQPDYIKGNPAP